MPDIVRPCVLSKGADVMPQPTLPTVCAFQGWRFHATPDVADRVCCPRAVMSCHTRRCRPCVLSKGGDVIQRPTLPTVYAVHGRCVMQRPTLPTVCVVQGG